MDPNGYSEDIEEKIDKLSRILYAIGNTKVLRDHLSLYGGTALNILQMNDPPRLSEDLDFNYRHFGHEEWGEKRAFIDKTIKRVLNSIGYSDDRIKIHPRYNLNQFFVRYATQQGKKDLIKIEIGYMRRIPVLTEDVNIGFHHPSSSTEVQIMSPQKEELFANKFCTMLSRMRKRPNARDVFDVVTISKLDFDRELFLDLIMVESILMDLHMNEIKFVPLGRSDLSFLDKLLVKKPDEKELNKRAKTFTDSILAELDKRNIEDFQSDFYKSGNVKLDLLHKNKNIHPEISNHPQLLWLRKKLKIQTK